MRILIFGGTGFVGLNIAAALLARYSIARACRRWREKSLPVTRIG